MRFPKFKTLLHKFCYFKKKLNVFEQVPLTLLLLSIAPTFILWQPMILPWARITTDFIIPYPLMEQLEVISNNFQMNLTTLLLHLVRQWLAKIWSQLFCVKILEFYLDVDRTRCLFWSTNKLYQNEKAITRRFLRIEI